MQSKKIKEVEATIAKMIRAGKPRIHYSELIFKCEISPTYARELLKAYAICNDFQYDKGYLIAT